MKMLLHAIFPNEPFNTLVRSGEVGKLMQRIFEDLKPRGSLLYRAGWGAVRDIGDQYRQPLGDTEIRRALLPEVQCQMPLSSGDEPR